MEQTSHRRYSTSQREMSSSSSKPLTPNNPLLEVNPSACLLVLGAAATGSKSCRELMEAATRYLQTCKKLSFSAKKKVIAEIKKADKTDVGAALQRAVRILKEADSLSEWLQLVFHEASPTPLSPTLEQCLELQKQGALLACTQLDSLPGTRQATLHDEDAFKSWLSSDTAEEEEEYINVESDDGSIVLHLCGIYTRLDTVWTGDEEDSTRNYEPRHKNAFVKFKNILQRRLVIFVGFQGETQNRFVLNFINNFYTQSTERVLKYPPIILTSPNWQRGSSRKEVEGNVFSHFLTLQVQEEDAALLGNLISRGSKRNFSVARGLTDKQGGDGTKYQAFLLFNEKQSFRKLGEIIYHQSQSGEIYVRRDALTVAFDSGRILYSNIITYGGSGLRQLWGLVFADGSTLLGKGLVAFGLQNSAIVWIRGRPDGLGDVSEVSTTYAGKNTCKVATTTMMSLAPQAPAITTQPKFPEGSSSLWHLPGTPIAKSSIHVGPRAGSVYNFPAVTTNGHIRIPPPPKLIKISEAAKSTTATDGPITVTSHISVISSTHDTKSIVENKEARYMQAIVDLQERIDHQLASGVCATSESGLAFIKPSLLSQTGEQDNVSSFCPPRYCVAEAPELLLDIISQTPFVKIHEHTIEQFERPTITRDRMHPPSLKPLTPRDPDTSTDVPKLIPQQSHPPPHSILMSHPPPHSTATSPSPSRRDSDMSRKRKAQSLGEEPPPLRRHRPNMLLSTVPIQSSSPIVHPIVTNQARIPTPMAATSIPNYCLALNTFPVMLVNPTMPMVQPIPLGAGLAGNQLLYYMTPNSFPAAEQQQANNTSSLILSPHTLSRTSPADCNDDLDYSKPLKIERVCNDAAKHIAGGGAGGGVSPVAGREDRPGTDNKVSESECSEEPEEVGSSSPSVSPHSTLASDGSVQLWIFLLDLLLSPDYRHIIQWTGHKYEFHIVQPAALAILWGSYRNRPHMTYEKMSRALRYYYSRGILETVRGRRQTFCFCLDIFKYVSSNKDKKTLDYLRSCCQL